MNKNHSRLSHRSISPTAHSISSLSSIADSIKSKLKKGAATVTRPFKKFKKALSSRTKSSATLDGQDADASNETAPPALQQDSSSLEIVETDPVKELSE
jgi:hypothetical protein